MKKSHLFFRNPIKGNRPLRVKTRYSPNQNEEHEQEINPDIYNPSKEAFQASLNTFFTDQQSRIDSRNIELEIPTNIEYILIKFWDSFDSKKFENKYRTEFGLAPIKFYEFNTEVLFVIIDEELFEDFLQNIEHFINSENPRTDTNYNHKVRFIKNFKLLTTSTIKKFEEINSYIRLEIVDSLDLADEIEQIIEKLIQYLDELKNTTELNYIIDLNHFFLEIENISEFLLDELLNNFDIIQSANSPRSGIITPSIYNLPQTTYGFEISNSTEDLPIIGIIDTGISLGTPLDSLLLNNNSEFDLTNTSPLVDNVNHGTGVAALVALGNKYILNEGQSEFESDAKLLSIKISDTNLTTQIKESDVVNLIRKAHLEFGVKIFTLNISYKDSKELNSPVSHYAYLLDTISHELDILILISVGNIPPQHFYTQSGISILEYPNQFDNEDAYINEPSDSFNNVSIGACVDNFEPFDNLNNHCREQYFPASYTRRFYFDYSHDFFRSRNGNLNDKRINKHLVKPDLIFSGGNYDRNLEMENTGLTIMSNNVSNAFFKHIGTSYSTPLLANIIAKILRIYPNISTQSIKALSVNSTNKSNLKGIYNSIEFPDHFIFGKGTVESPFPLFSNEKQITIILEDDIAPSNIKSYEINFPEYLLNVSRNKALLKISATLAFSFDPIFSNHLSYCPIDISFGIFRNLDIDDINGKKTEDYKFRESWSQDYYYKNKMLSNCQKIEFNISKENLISEDNTFTIVIKSQLHKLIRSDLVRKYNKPNKFTIVITILDNSGSENNLYDEMFAINNLEVISQLEAEIELEN